MEMSWYLYHNLILMKQTYPEIFVNIGHDDVILWHMTSFPYIFPYYDVIGKSADISKNNDVIQKVSMENKSTYVTLLSCKVSPSLHKYYEF